MLEIAPRPPRRPSDSARSVGKPDPGWLGKFMRGQADAARRLDGGSDGVARMRVAEGTTMVVRESGWWDVYGATPPGFPSRFEGMTFEGDAIPKPWREWADRVRVIGVDGVRDEDARRQSWALRSQVAVVGPGSFVAQAGGDQVVVMGDLRFDGEDTDDGTGVVALPPAPLAQRREVLVRAGVWQERGIDAWRRRLETGEVIIVGGERLVVCRIEEYEGRRPAEFGDPRGQEWPMVRVFARPARPEA